MHRDFRKKARIVLIDDNYEHLMGVKELLNLEGCYDVVQTSTSVSTGVNMVKKYQPDIVLVDMNMPDKNGLQAIHEIQRLGVNTKILALSAYDDADLIFRAMKVGARGYVLKTMASAQLICAIEEVLTGKIYLPSALSLRFFEYFQKSVREEEETTNEELLSSLTQREEEVLDLLTQGFGYNEVSDKLYISNTTVKTHVNNIFQKLQVRDRTQAVLYALKHGFDKKRKAKFVSI
ncbi:MAG: response regulator transcription factor [Cyanobacteria bacterium RUI128]|nr:response regulator transcription factor [Cyanobacteria bacterium RUI128]